MEFKPSSSFQLTKTSAADLPAMVSCGRRAFEGNPLFTWLLGNGRAYNRRIGPYLRYMITGARIFGDAWHGGDPRQGFMLLVPDSDRLFTLANEIRAGGLSLIFRCGLGTIFRSLEFEALAQRVRCGFPESKSSHLYIYLLASEPDMQGKGLGTFLLGHAQAEASRRGVPLILETMTPENIAYYQKRGFKLMSQERVVPGSFDFSAMMWTPPIQ